MEVDSDDDDSDNVCITSESVASHWIIGRSVVARATDCTGSVKEWVSERSSARGALAFIVPGLVFAISAYCTHSNGHIRTGGWFFFSLSLLLLLLILIFRIWLWYFYVDWRLTFYGDHSFSTDTCIHFIYYVSDVPLFIYFAVVFFSSSSTSFLVRCYLFSLYFCQSRTRPIKMLAFSLYPIVANVVALLRSHSLRLAHTCAISCAILGHYVWHEYAISNNYRFE